MRRVAVFSSLVIFLLAFADAIAFSLDEGDVGVMGEPVKKGGDAGGVGKDGVPVLEGEIGGENDRAAGVVTGIDDVVEEVGGVLVVGEISELVNGEKPGAEVLLKSPAAKLGRITIEIVE